MQDLLPKYWLAYALVVLSLGILGWFLHPALADYYGSLPEGGHITLLIIAGLAVFFGLVLGLRAFCDIALIFIIVLGTAFFIFTPWQVALIFCLPIFLTFFFFYLFRLTIAEHRRRNREHDFWILAALVEKKKDPNQEYIL